MRFTAAVGRACRAARVRGRGPGVASVLRRRRPHHARAGDHRRRPADGYATLDSQPVNGSYVVRDGAGEAIRRSPTPQAGRDEPAALADLLRPADRLPARRRGVAGAGRVHRAGASGFAASAWRPQEALQPFIIDWSIRQMNLFAGASPVQQGDGSRAAMDFALMTGDQADNMQRNEILWTRELLEGGSRSTRTAAAPNPADWDPLAHPSCAAVPADVANLAEAREVHRRAGLRRLRRGAQPLLLRPRLAARRQWADWPDVPGPDGPRAAAVHGCRPRRAELRHERKPRRPRAGQRGRQRGVRGHRHRLLQDARHDDGRTRVLDPSVLLSPSSAHMLVPPDPLRRFVDKRQIKAEYAANGADDAHGYEFVDADENTELERLGLLLRLGPARGAGLPLHLDRHPLRGRHRRAVLERQHRRPAVPVARARAGVAAGRRQADRGLRPPPDPVAQLERRRRGGGRLHRRHPHARRRARARPQPRLRHRPARLGADPLRRAEPAAAGRHGRDALAAARPASRT